MPSLKDNLNLFKVRLQLLKKTPHNQSNNTKHTWLINLKVNAGTGNGTSGSFSVASAVSDPMHFASLFFSFSILSCAVFLVIVLLYQSVA